MVRRGEVNMSRVEKIRNFYENLKIEDVVNLSEIYVDNALFKDPFNELNSLADIRKVFDEMFHKLENPKFIFIDQIESSDQIFLTWNFVFSYSNKNFKIHGSTHLKVNTTGKITYHRDYWDVGEELLLKIPVVKSLYSLLRKKMSVQ